MGIYKETAKSITLYISYKAVTQVIISSSNMSMLAVLKRMKRTDITVHGFRSTFPDWTAESTTYPGEVVEMSLAHAIKNLTEVAYRRGDLMEKTKSANGRLGTVLQAIKLVTLS